MIFQSKSKKEVLENFFQVGNKQSQLIKLTNQTLQLYFKFSQLRKLKKMKSYSL